MSRKAGQMLVLYMRNFVDRPIKHSVIHDQAIINCAFHSTKIEAMSDVIR